MRERRVQFALIAGVGIVILVAVAVSLLLWQLSTARSVAGVAGETHTAQKVQHFQYPKSISQQNLRVTTAAQNVQHLHYPKSNPQQNASHHC